MNMPYQINTGEQALNKRYSTKWVLLVLFVTSIAIVLGITGTGNAASSYGLLTESPPPSPIETPSPLEKPPVIHEVSPNEGAVGIPHRLNVYGKNFTGESQVFLIPSETRSAGLLQSQLPAGAIRLDTVFVGHRHLIGHVPASIRPGIYHVGVYKPDTTPAVKEKAYFAFRRGSSENTDLSSRAELLWTNPKSVWVDDPVQIGLTVRRTGEKGGTLSLIAVDFYEDAIDSEHFIGRGIIPLLGPDSKETTSPVSWTPSNRGNVTLIAVIDPDNQVPESNEDNNIIEREILVRFLRPQDTTPPVADQLTINEGTHQVTDPNIKLTVDAHDPGEPSSGVSAFLHIELHPLFGMPGVWIPVKWTQWLPATAQPHDFTLHPTPGIRYLQSWVADAAGNISIKPATRRLNYVPANDSLMSGEVRVYRRAVAANQCLRVRIIPTESQMDVDLYVWPPDYTSGSSNFFYSILGPGETDEVVVQPTQQGIYQIEVEALTDATYSISIERSASCNTGRAVDPAGERSAAAKTPRSEPFIPTNDQPDDDAAAPDSPEEQLLFLPTTYASIKINASETQDLYLPIMVR